MTRDKVYQLRHDLQSSILKETNGEAIRSISDDMEFA
jgi:hypothetical protein